MTTVENRWTVGNIAALVGVAIGILVNFGGLVWWGASLNNTVSALASRIEANASDTEKRFEAQARDSRRQLDLQATMLGNYNARLRDVERAYARLDEKVSTILETVREVRDVVKVQPNTEN